MEASEEKMEQPCWADMFPDALVKIFSVLPLYDLLHSIPFVCSAWHKASLDAACWTHVDLSLWCCGKDTLTYSRMLSLVVGRSQGALKHIIAPNLIKDSMLQIIAHSAYDDVVPARGKALIKTDLSIAIPEGTYARLAPRSGLAWKHSIDVGAGVIDADYRGPVAVILFNLSDQDFVIKAGDRVAQLILEKIVTPDVLEVDDLEATVRGEGGFGSTGVATVILPTV